MVAGDSRPWGRAASGSCAPAAAAAPLCRGYAARATRGMGARRRRRGGVGGLSASGGGGGGPASGRWRGAGGGDGSGGDGASSAAAAAAREPPAALAVREARRARWPVLVRGGGRVHNTFRAGAPSQF